VLWVFCRNLRATSLPVIETATLKKRFSSSLFRRTGHSPALLNLFKLMAAIASVSPLLDAVLISLSGTFFREQRRHHLASVTSFNAAREDQQLASQKVSLSRRHRECPIRSERCISAPDRRLCRQPGSQGDSMPAGRAGFVALGLVLAKAGYPAASATPPILPFHHLPERT